MWLHPEKSASARRGHPAPKRAAMPQIARESNLEANRPLTARHRNFLSETLTKLGEDSERVLASRGHVSALHGNLDAPLEDEDIGFVPERRRSILQGREAAAPVMDSEYLRGESPWLSSADSRPNSKQDMYSRPNSKQDMYSCGGSTQSGGSCGSMLIKQQMISELDHWREQFRGEVQSCLQELRKVAEMKVCSSEDTSAKSSDDHSSLSQLVQQLSTVQKANETEMAVLRQHVEELLRLNGSLRQATLDQQKVGELARVTSSMTELSHNVHDMIEVKRQEHPVELAKVAEEAATRALGNMERAVKKQIQAFLDVHRDMHQSRWKAEDEERQKLGQEITGLHVNFKELQEALKQQQRDMIKEIGEEPKLEQLDVLANGLPASATRGTAKSGVIRRGALLPPGGGGGAASPQDIADEVLVRLTPRFDVVMQELSNGSGAKKGCSEALKKPLSLLEEQVVKEFKKAGDAEVELRKIRVDCFETTALNKQYLKELQAVKKTLEAEGERGKVLSSRYHTMDSELTECKQTLEENTKTEGVRFVKGIQPIAQRHNVAVNFAMGTVDIKKTIEFKVMKKDPAAVFVNEATALEVLQDAVEILQLLSGVPVTIEAHVKQEKGGTEAYWEELAANRAAAVKKMMGSKGLDLDTLSAVGFAGKKGQNNNSILLRLQLDAFW